MKVVFTHNCEIVHFEIRPIVKYANSKTNSKLVTGMLPLQRHHYSTMLACLKIMLLNGYEAKATHR